MATRLHQPSPSCAAPAQRNGGWGLAGLPARAASELAVSPRPTAQASVSCASGHRYPRIARAKAATPGEKRRPVIDTSETWRTTSGVGNEASEDAGDNRPKLRDKTDTEPGGDHHLDPVLPLAAEADLDRESILAAALVQVVLIFTIDPQEIGLPSDRRLNTAAA